jgi:hypothetical protein
MAGLLQRVFSARGMEGSPVIGRRSNKLEAEAKLAAETKLAAERAKQLADERAKESFTSRLKSILDRPEPTVFECGCCGGSNQLDQNERLDARCIFTNLELRRYRCTGCDAIFGPIPLIQCTPAELGTLYELLYSFYSEGATQRFQEKTFYMMNPSSHADYLNYACGDWIAGVDRLRAYGWRIWGFEPFQQVSSPAILNDYESLMQRTYAGLMSNNYLEHVQYPAAFFNECFKLIVPGGKMAHSTACYEYIYEYSPFHLYFPCGDSVRKLAQRTNFRILGEQRIDQEHKDCSYICVLFEKMA